eukprot:1167254-Alexandrium_andersonii.AAC.1
MAADTSWAFQLRRCFCKTCLMTARSCRFSLPTQSASNSVAATNAAARVSNGAATEFDALC